MSQHHFPKHDTHHISSDCSENLRSSITLNEVSEVGVEVTLRYRKGNWDTRECLKLEMCH
jgi:hypothetical protein